MPGLLHRTALALVLAFGFGGAAHASAHAAAKPLGAKAPAAKTVHATKTHAPAKVTARGGKNGKAGKAAVSKPAPAPVVHKRVPRGTMTLRNINTRDHFENLRIVDVTKRGRKEISRISARGKKKLGWMLRDFRNGVIRQPPDRLLTQLYQVQQHFDAPIEIVSGYRHWARKTSRHFRGFAVDFRVEGVEPRIVWEFCKQFPNVGCGQYPTSSFVHMDIRDESYSWIDYSGPGQRARYDNPVSQAPAKQMPAAENAESEQ